MIKAKRPEIMCALVNKRWASVRQREGWLTDSPTLAGSSDANRGSPSLSKRGSSAPPFCLTIEDVPS